MRFFQVLPDRDEQIIVAHDPKDAPASPVESTPEISGAIAEDPAIDSLQDRLAAARRAEEARLARENTPLQNNATSGATRIASTMIGYPVGGIVIGYFLDRFRSEEHTSELQSQ